MARPKRQLSSLPKDWKALIASLYAEGASDAEVRHALHVSDDLFERWLKEEPEFSLAVKAGRQASEAWWTRLGREGAKAATGINPTVWIFNMKNRFGWRDKRETEVSGKDGAPLGFVVVPPKSE